MTITPAPEAPSNKGVRSARELLAESFEVMERASQQPNEVPEGHLSTGFADLDAVTLGLRRGSLVVLAGSTGMGKTALALNLARNIALQGQVAVHICTLDSSPTALLQRMLASLCSVESGRLVSSRLTAEEWPRLGEAMALLSAAPLFFSGQAINTVAAVRSRCQEIAAQSSQPLGLVVIDSLQLLSGDPSEQLKELRLLAAELEACVLLTAKEWPRLGEVMAQLSAAPLFFSGQAINTVAAIRARCLELAAQSSQPLGLVVIDSLQLLSGDPAEQLKELRLLAAELEACVLLTCQSLPSVELRPGGVPLLHDLPALEAMQTYPHLIAMLHREDYFNPGTSHRGEAQLILLKNSDNPVGMLRFGFQPQFSRFLELEPISTRTQLT